MYSRNGCGALIGVCLSSRHYPQIVTRQGLEIVVENEPEHDDDIEKYVERKLMYLENGESGELVKKLCHKSQGIFLWVVLVIPVMEKLYSKGYEVQDLYKKLEDIPEDLDRLFAEIILRDEEDINECLLLLRCVYVQHCLSVLESCTLR